MGGKRRNFPNTICTGMIGLKYLDETYSAKSRKHNAISMSAWQNATCDEGRVSGSRWRRGGGWGNVTDVTDLRGRHTKWKAFRSLEKQSSQIYFFSLWQWIIIESGHIKCILRVFQGNRESSSSVFWVIFCVEFPNFRVGSIFCRLKLEVGESHLDRFTVQCQEILKT